LRGLENVKGEWDLVTMSWNLKRTFTLQAARNGQRRLPLRRLRSSCRELPHDEISDSLSLRSQVRQAAQAASDYPEIST